MDRGQDDGHPLLPHYRLHAHGSHDLPTATDICYITGESKDVVSTSNKEENNENDEDMFDRVSGCLQEREAATFGAGSAPETAAPETADWPAPGCASLRHVSATQGQGYAVADAAMCTCCWL